MWRLHASLKFKSPRWVIAFLWCACGAIAIGVGSFFAFDEIMRVGSIFTLVLSFSYKLHALLRNGFIRTFPAIKLAKGGISSDLSMCIDQIARTFADRGDNLPRDTHNEMWQRKRNPSIIPVERGTFKTRPGLITFDPINTLIEPSQSIGRWLRESLNTVCEMTIRLPKPMHFSEAFKKAFADM